MHSLNLVVGNSQIYLQFRRYEARLELGLELLRYAFEALAVCFFLVLCDPWVQSHVPDCIFPILSPYDIGERITATGTDMLASLFNQFAPVLLCFPSVTLTCLSICFVLTNNTIGG